MHVCDEDLVKTVEEIERSTKACPGCGNGIHRIEGCSVMFCTLCNTAFDYQTGEQLRHNIHNPHFYEYLQQNREAALAVEGDRYDEYVAEQQAAAGNMLCTPPAILELQEFDYDPVHRREALAIRRLYDHMEDEKRKMHDELQLAKDDEAYTRDLRVKFMMHDITENEFKRELYMRDRATEKMQELHQMFDTMGKSMCDILHRFLREPYSNVHAEAVGLRDCFNKATGGLYKRFGTKMPFINSGWILSM